VPTRPVYSTRFLAWAAETTPPAYTVPTGYLAIVRDVSVTTAGGSITNFRAAINDVAGYAAGAFTDEALPQQFHWEGRVVAEPGELLTFAGDSATDGVISGYLLLLP